MKVGFDGILLGAWANTEQCASILDIGTGTGLLALMLAQRTEDAATDSPILIKAIEIDEMAVGQAKANVAASPWPRRINVIHRSFQSFATASSHLYDLLVCNPPYFARNPSGQESARSIARHEDSLPFSELSENTAKMMTELGRLCVILPTERERENVALAAEHQLFCRRRKAVRSLPGKSPHRILLEFRREAGPIENAQITIEEQRHVYTEAFKALARDFYLAF